jgi:protein TonB
MSSVYKSPKGKNTRTVGVLLGLAVSALIFLAIPLTQIFTEYTKVPSDIEAIEMAAPPPPPPEDEPPPPPEPEEEEPPPELDTPPPPVSLEQLDMALDAGTGDSLSGDFALPTVDLKQNLGSLDIFDLSDVEKKPQPRKQTPPKFPMDATRRGLSGYAVAVFVVDEYGNVIDVDIPKSSDAIFEQPTITAIRTWKFSPGEKDGKAVKTRIKIRIPYEIE